MNAKTHQANKNNLLNWSKAETNTWHPNFNEECEATSNVDLEKLNAFREKFPVLDDADGFERK